jgi:hypothetical protein
MGLIVPLRVAFAQVGEVAGPSLTVHRTAS